MKILYINHAFNRWGGDYIHGKKIAENLKKLGVSIKTIPTERDERTLRFNINFLRILMLSIPSYLREYIIFIKQNILSIMRLVKIYYSIKSDKPNCILIRVNLYDLSPVLIRKSFKIPIILEVNEAFYLERKLHYESRNIKAKIPKFLSSLDIKIWRCADAIYVVSNILSKIIKSQLGDKSPLLWVIPNGVDEDNIKKVSCRELKEKTEFIKICFAGSLEFWHGADLLLKVYKDIARLRPKTKLVIIGDGITKRNLENYVSLHNDLKNRVIFTGKLSHDDTMSSLSNMDILVAPYKVTKIFYFSPIKIFEYMASGKAIIASRLGQISEILENGIDAILINPEKQNELRDALITLIDSEDKRTRLGNMSYNKAKQYTWERSAKSLLNLMQKIVRENTAYL